MTTTPAQIALTLENGQFLVQIKKVGDEIEKTAKKGKEHMSLFDAGVKGAEHSLEHMGHVVKEITHLVGGLAAGFGLEEGIRGAINMDARMKTLTFRIQTMTGELIDQKEIHELIEGAAHKSGQKTVDLADAFEMVVEKTKDFEFTSDVIDAIGTQATATGEKVETLATVAEQMHRKFGLSADETRESMISLFQVTEKQGPKMEEFAQVLDVVGANLINAGLNGQRGLRFVMGALAETSKPMGGLHQSVTGLDKLLLNLGKGAELKAIAKDLGIDSKKLFDDKDALDRIKHILSFGKAGLATLKAHFVGPEEQKALKILFTDPFENALKTAQASGLDGKNSIDQALGVLQTRIGKFGESTMTVAQMEEEAAKRMQDPKQRLQQAMNTLEASFERPEIINAITDLAQYLPQLAKIFSDLVGFAVKNPILAGLLGIGGQAAMGFVSGMFREIVRAHTLGGAAAGREMDKHGGHGGGAGGGVGIAGNLMAGAAIASTAVAAYGIGTEFIDAAYAKEGDMMKELANATAAGFTGGGSKKELEQRLKRLKNVTNAAANSNVGTGAMDLFARGTLGLGHMLGINDAPPNTNENRMQAVELASSAIGRLEDKIAHMKEAEPVAESAKGKPTKVTFDPDAGKMVGFAVVDGLKGQTLDVRIKNIGELHSLGRAHAGPGGSRGPVAVPPAQQGGGY
jgi:hypothetical protein